MKKQIFIVILLVSIASFGQNNVFPTPNGNTGIGIDPPTAKLEVYASGNYFVGGVGTTFSKDIAKFSSKSLTAASKFSLNLTHTYSHVTSPAYTFSSRLQSVLDGASNSFIEWGSRTRLDVAIGIGQNNATLMQILNDGKVIIGDVTTPGDYKLYVDDGILTEKVKVAIKTTGDWADYVFQPDYELMPLQEVAAFTQQNGHLPNVPSAEEMVADGLDVAKMDAKLLEKIEELTLYAIDQDKQIDSLEAKLAKQEQEMAEMKAQLKTLIEQKQ